MGIKSIVFFILLGSLIFSGCGDSVAIPTGLFMPNTDLNTTALCSINLTNVKVETKNSSTGKPALKMQGSVGAYCGQLEMKMAPVGDTGEVRIVVVAESPKTAPSAAELKTTKPVYINMTLDTLPKGRYTLFVNGTKYQTFSTP